MGRIRDSLINTFTQTGERRHIDRPLKFVDMKAETMPVDFLTLGVVRRATLTLATQYTIGQHELQYDPALVHRLDDGMVHSVMKELYGDVSDRIMHVAEYFLEKGDHEGYIKVMDIINHIYGRGSDEPR